MVKERVQIGAFMTLTIEIPNEIQAALARKAAMNGMGLETFAAGLLKEAAQQSATPGASKTPLPANARDAAIERLRIFGKTHGLSLGGITIRELRDEARL